MRTESGVLWIIADQLRYQALGFTGDPNAVTPAIDALASSGVSCSNAVTPSPVCTPARAALMTALPGNVSGVERHGDFLDPSMATLATTFVAAGYRTSYVGKWHLAPESGAHMVSAEGWVGQDFWVHPRLRGGFQDWFGFNLSNNYYRTYIASGDKVEPRRLPGYQTYRAASPLPGCVGRSQRHARRFHVRSWRDGRQPWPAQ